MFNIKKNLQVTLIFILAIALTGCLGVSPDSVTIDFLTAVKDGDFDSVSKYIKLDGGDEFRDELVSGQDLDDEKRVELIFSKLSWEILSSDSSGDDASVEAKITSIDMVSVVTDVMGKIMPLAFASAFDEDADDSNIEELTEQYFENALSDPDAPTVTSDITIKLVKEDGDWLIVPDDDLLNALTGNAGKLAEMF